MKNIPQCPKNDTNYWSRIMISRNFRLLYKHLNDIYSILFHFLEREKGGRVGERERATERRTIICNERIVDINKLKITQGTNT